MKKKQRKTKAELNIQENYIIIPLAKDKLEVIKNTESIESNTSFITGLNLMGQLEKVDTYPIQNKRIAINNILTFLKVVQSICSYKDSTCIPISSDILTDILTCKHYKRYMILLKELEVLSVVPYADGKFYEIGKRTAQYQLFNKYINDELCLVIMNSEDQVNLVKDQRYEARFEKTIKKMEVNYRDAILAEFKHVEDNNLDQYNLLMRINKLLSLNGFRYMKTGNRVNRVYHSLTNLSKVSRKHLHINGQTFNDIDIVNCQPLLLCYLLKSENHPMDSEYLNVCQQGIFYDGFVGELTRDEAKVQLYKNIFFDFKPKSRIAIKFKELYPKTYSSLEILNKDEVTLASKLQNIEASIFNSLSPVKSKYYYTLFDSIYFSDIDDCGILIKEIRNRFKELEISPMLTMNGGTEFDIQESLVESEECKKSELKINI